MDATAVSLERIANSLEEIVKLLSIQFGVVPKSMPEKFDAAVTSAEEEFFKRITRVYYDEETLRRATQGQRKSARRVSEQIGGELTTFFAQQLPQYNVSSHHGLLMFYQDDSIVAVLKYITDLGYTRGDQWYDYINSILGICQSRYKVPPSNVFFMISSILNGLDNKHVKKILGKPITNAELIMNRTILESYLNSYVKEIKTLPNPTSQVFFAGAEIHPNVLATEWLNTGIEPKVLNTYSWLKPSVSDLIKNLSTINN